MLMKNLAPKLPVMSLKVIYIFQVIDSSTVYIEYVFVAVWGSMMNI